MGAPNLKISDPVTGNEIFELVFPKLANGALTPVQTVRLTNISNPAVLMTLARVAAKLITGVVSPIGSSDGQGAEMIDEKWVEVRVGVGAFQAIGGDYGNGSPAANYYPVANLASGASIDLEVRIRVPATPSTPDTAWVRLGLSYQPA